MPAGRNRTYSRRLELAPPASPPSASVARMKIGVVGRGIVGKAVESLFAQRSTVVAWDITESEPYPTEELTECACVFVCVPTPGGENGEADLTQVKEAIGRIPNNRIVLKSTVPPGATAQLSTLFDKDICYWPEYIGESSYHNPFFTSAIESMPFVVVGGASDTRAWALTVLQRVLGPTKTYFQCSSLEAELIKYIENAFFAAKVTFANEFKKVCEAHQADWNIVREGWILDPRVSPMHTAVFEHDPGFGGKCLPKDLRAIVHSARDLGYEPELLEQVLRSNAQFRNEA